MKKVSNYIFANNYIKSIFQEKCDSIHTLEHKINLTSFFAERLRFFYFFILSQAVVAVLLLMICVVSSSIIPDPNSLQLNGLQTWVRIINSLSARGLLTERDFRRFSEYNFISLAYCTFKIYWVRVNAIFTIRQL